MGACNVLIRYLALQEGKSLKWVRIRHTGLIIDMNRLPRERLALMKNENKLEIYSKQQHNKNISM